MPKVGDEIYIAPYYGTRNYIIPAQVLRVSKNGGCYILRRELHGEGANQRVVEYRKNIGLNYSTVEMHNGYMNWATGKVEEIQR